MEGPLETLSSSFEFSYGIESTKLCSTVLSCGLISAFALFVLRKNLTILGAMVNKQRLNKCVIIVIIVCIYFFLDKFCRTEMRLKYVAMCDSRFQ